MSHGVRRILADVFQRDVKTIARSRSRLLGATGLPFSPQRFGDHVVGDNSTLGDIFQTSFDRLDDIEMVQNIIEAAVIG